MANEFGPEVLQALATLRLYAAGQNRDVRREFRTLDDAGVFARLDEQTDYASAEAILAESARDDLEAAVPNTADPAEWGDTTSADMARHQGYAAVSRLGSLERVPGTDQLVPRHEHAFRSPHSDEVCYAVEWCMATLGEHRQEAARR